MKSAEQIIRETLDGTFVRVGLNGVITPTKVDDGFLPKYSAIGAAADQAQRYGRGKKKKWPPETIAEIIRLRDEGKTFPQIGATVGLNYKTCNELYIRERGRTRNGRHPWTPAEDQVLLAMRKARRTPREISIRLNRSEHACYERSRRLSGIKKMGR